MHVKTYRGRSAKEALDQVRAELGEEAVILSNKTITDNGAKVCEITAAVERSESLRDRSREDVLGEALDAAEWSREWRHIKSCLLSLMRPQMDPAALAPRQRLSLEYLEREGVDQDVLLAVYRRLRADASLSILPVLQELAPVRPFESKKWPQKFHALAGPHGAGKTTSLVRLALREKKKNPKARICLVSADQGQGKGRMVLRHYAELSGLAFREVAVREDFGALVADARSFDRVFLDLPGLPPGASLETWLGSRAMLHFEDLAVHLVLNPYYCPAQFQAFRERYACAAVKSIIWTKLDEACTFGALINLPHGSGLPVSALSCAPGLTGSLVPARGEMIWRLLFKHQLPAEGLAA
jgi:flagellar biosynthesis protein FlhF